MRRLNNLWIVLMMSLSLVACDRHVIKGNGHVVTQQRVVPGFETLAIDGDFLIVLNSHQASSSLQVKADSNIQPYVMSEIDHGKLHLYIKSDYKVRPSVPIELRVNAKQLQQISLSDKADLTASNLSNNNLDVKLADDSRAVLMGDSANVNYAVSGAGQLDAKGLTAQQVTVNVNGMGQLTVNVTKKLEVFIKGLGKVTYVGQPPIINQEIYDGGQLIKGQQ